MQKAKRIGQSVNHIEVGDVDMVHSDNNKRVLWPLAIVTKLRFGTDGLVRSAEIRTTTGISNRPIAKLYPIEVQLNSDRSIPESNIVFDVKTTLRRPVRQSAMKARTLINMMI